MAQLISVKLSRFDGSPWGFRLQGGKDFGTPLIVQKVNGGSPAEQAGLRAGDAVIRVNNTDMFNLRHKDAQDVIVRSGNSFEVTVQRGGSTWRPSVSPTTASIPSPQPSAPASCVSPVTKTSLAAKKQDVPLIGSGHNVTPKAFLNGSSEGPIKSIVNKQYNSPVGIYSEETIAETLSAQAEVLAGGVLGVNFKKNERNYNAENSEVFKMVQEADKEPKTPEPAEPAPHSGVIMPSSPALTSLRSVSAPETKPRPTTPQTSLPPGQNICADCERLIVGVFVRIKEKNLHVECFKCSTCGTSLKNVGYYNINNKLYCDIHAKLVARQQAPAGLTPITVPPGGKAPAGTISAALTSLGGGAPLSPPLNSHGSPQPFTARINGRSRGDYGSPTRRESRHDPPTYCTTNDQNTPRKSSLTNGTSIYDECDSYTRREDCCDGKTYTSTITFRTGNEVGRLDDRINEIVLDDNNPDRTNESMRLLPENHWKTRTLRDNKNPRSFVRVSPLFPPETPAKIAENGNEKKDFEISCSIWTSNGSNEKTDSNNLNDRLNRENSEKRDHVALKTSQDVLPGRSQTPESSSFTTYSTFSNPPWRENCRFASTIRESRYLRQCDPENIETSQINGKTSNGNASPVLNNRRYRITKELVPRKENRVQNGTNHHNDSYNNYQTDKIEDRGKFEFNGFTNGQYENGSNGTYKNDKNNAETMLMHEMNCVIPGYRTIGNGRQEFTGSCLSNSRGSLSDSVSSGSKPPTPLPQPSTSSSPSSSHSQTAKLPNRIGTPPIDISSFRPVQSHTSNNVGGPKPFGGSSINAPSNFSTAPVLNSGSNTLPRSPSQTVTENYYEESDYYDYSEVPVTESATSRVEKHNHQETSSVSVKSKGHVWPPVKQIEDITYPTASPIWIDPNPVLDRRPRQNVHEKRTTIQEASDSRCGSWSESRCGSRYEERDYERYSVTSSSSRLANNREPSMDRASCSQPFYRKVEVTTTRRDARPPPVYTPRPSSTDGVSRSLTPTRISQPIPKPWVATVTTVPSCFYGHVEPPPPPEPVCQEVCRCRIICERMSGPQGPQHEQRHTYREITCELCRPPAPPQDIRVRVYTEPKQQPQEVVREADDEVVDLSKVVPPDVAMCPKGVENQHNMFTETMEKDVGDIHIKKTTIYEKTVEVMTPERARSPEPEENQAKEVIEPSSTVGQGPTTEDESRPCEQEVYETISRDETIRRNSTVSTEATVRRSSATLDNEGEKTSKRNVGSAEVLSSSIDTALMMEAAKQEEEESKCEYEKVRREEQERLQRLEEECKEQERRYEEEKARRIEKKRALASGSQQRWTLSDESSTTVECCHHTQCVRQEETVPEEGTASEERYHDLTEEIKIQEDFQQLEEERRQSIREQVQVHQSIREQQQPPQQPERRQSLQERRLCSRFRDTQAEREARQRQYEQQQAQQQSEQQQSESVSKQSTETCQRKHVQFVTQAEPAPTRPLPPSKIKNATAKEWKTSMRTALTTAPERPYSPFESSSCQQTEESETDSRIVYSSQVTYEQTCKPCPAPPPPEPEVYPETDRPVSPFQAALITAPGRPYSLGRGTIESYDNVICINRSATPVDSLSNDGYCHPAEILYSDEKTREARSRERHLKRVEGPMPLPVPPVDHRLRDASASPARSRPGTPKDRSLMTGLKKPGTIPSYQRYLVSMQQDAVEGCYIPSRSPTPNRTKSPGPPEHSACFSRAQAPRIRESPPPCKRTSVSTYQQQSSTPCPPPEQRASFTYTVQRNPSADPRGEAYYGIQRSYYSDDSHCEQVESVYKTTRVEESANREEESTVAVRQQNEHEDTPSCGIGKVNRLQPSLACPLSHCSGSDRFPRTGVRVLPPCPPPIAPSQSYETRRIVHEERTASANSCSAFTAQRCSNNSSSSGVTIMPCKTTSSSGTKAGVVIVPSEDSDYSSSRGGICVTPTFDRSGVCVSPITHGQSSSSCGKKSGARSGGCNIDVGNCPASGVRVAACGDGSLSVQPCTIPGYSSVPCPKPILKCPKLPYPQIPLPNNGSAPPCDDCPANDQPEPQQVSTTCTTIDQSFQPIPEKRTNLSAQLTQLTVRRDKQHVVQLLKPQAQCQSQYLITDTVCQSTSQSQNPGPNCNTQRYVDPPNLSSQPDLGSGIGAPGAGGRGGKFAGSSAPKRGRGILNQAGGPGSRQPLCAHCSCYVRGPFITALGQIWCPEHFVCINSQCRRALQDIGFVEEKGQLHCEYCFERFIAPGCSKCNNKIKGDCLNAVGKHFHPECFNCSYCGKLFGNSPFFLEDGLPYCEADWNELFTTKCFACGFPVEAGDRWVEALNNNYHSQCFNCTMCKKNLEGQSFYAKGGRPFCKNHAR